MSTIINYHGVITRGRRPTDPVHPHGLAHPRGAPRRQGAPGLHCAAQVAGQEPAGRTMVPTDAHRREPDVPGYCTCGTPHAALWRGDPMSHLPLVIVEPRAWLGWKLLGAADRLHRFAARLDDGIPEDPGGERDRHLPRVPGAEGARGRHARATDPALHDPGRADQRLSAPRQRPPREMRWGRCCRIGETPKALRERTGRRRLFTQPRVHAAGRRHRRMSPSGTRRRRLSVRATCTHGRE